jgi:hypothetical protein
VSVKSNQGFAGTHPAKQVAHRVYLDFVESQFAHLLGAALYFSFFLAALAGDFY